VEVRYPSKASFAVTVLGNWQLPVDHAGIPAPTWQVAVMAATAADKDTAGPAAAVVALAEARAAARGAKDWPAADRIRDELAAQGWQVNDTAAGPQLSRIKES
jgi:cysteinyl-tRNA synthetase